MFHWMVPITFHIGKNKQNHFRLNSSNQTKTNLLCQYLRVKCISISEQQNSITATRLYYLLYTIVRKVVYPTSDVIKLFGARNAQLLLAVFGLTK